MRGSPLGHSLANEVIMGRKAATIGGTMHGAISHLKTRLPAISGRSTAVPVAAGSTTVGGICRELAGQVRGRSAQATAMRVEAATAARQAAIATIRRRRAATPTRARCAARTMAAIATVTGEVPDGRVSRPT